MTSRKRTPQGEAEQLVLFPPARYLTIDEVAEILAVPKSFIYRRTCRGHADPIPSFRFGGHLRFRLDEIEAWISSHRVEHEDLPRIPPGVKRAAAANRIVRRSKQRLQAQTNSVKSRSG